MKEIDVSKLVKQTLETVQFDGSSVKVRLEHAIQLSACPIITYNLINDSTLKSNVKTEKTRSFSYVVNVWTKDAVSRSEIGSSVDDVMKTLNFVKTQGLDSFEDDTKIFRRYMVFRVEADLDNDILYYGG